MNCEEARTQFVDYWRGLLEDPLGEFRNHLASCERCKAEAEDLKGLWGIMDGVPEADPSLGMRVRFYDSLREWRRKEGERRQAFWWLRHPVFQAAAAVLILVVGISTGYLARGRETTEVSQLRGEVDRKSVV